MSSNINHSLQGQTSYLHIETATWSLHLPVNAQEHSELIEAALKIITSSSQTSSLSSSSSFVLIDHQDKKGQNSLISLERISKIDQTYQTTLPAPISCSKSQADHLQSLLKGGASLAQLLSIQEEKRFLSFINASYNINLLASSGVSLDELIEVNDEELISKIFYHSYDVRELLSTGQLSFSQILEIQNREIRLTFIKRTYGIAKLFSHGISFQKLLALEGKILLPILEDSLTVSDLIDKGIPFEKLIELEDEVRTKVIDKSRELHQLLEATQYSFADLITLDKELLCLLLDQEGGVCYFLKKHSISFKELLAIDRKFLIKILENIYSVDNFFEIKKFSFDQLLKIQDKEFFILLIKNFYNIQELLSSSFDLMMNFEDKRRISHIIKNIHQSTLFSQISLSQLLSIKDDELFYFIVDKNMMSFSELLSNGSPSFDELMSLEDRELLFKIIDHAYGVKPLFTHLSFGELMSLDRELLTRIIRSCYGVCDLLKTAKLSLSELINLEKQRELPFKIIDESSAINELLSITSLSFDQFIAIDRPVLDAIAKNIYQLPSFLKEVDIPFEQLLTLDKSLLIKIIENSHELKKCLKVGKVSFRDFINVSNKELLHTILDHVKNITTLCETLSFNELITIQDKAILSLVIYHAPSLLTDLKEKSIPLTEWLKEDPSLIKEKLHQIKSQDLAKLFQDYVNDPTFDPQSCNLLRGYPEVKALMEIQAHVQIPPPLRLKEMIELSQDPQEQNLLLNAFSVQSTHDQEHSLKSMAVYLSLSSSCRKESTLLNRDPKGHRVLKTLFNYKNLSVATSGISLLFDFYHRKLASTQVDSLEQLWKAKSDLSYKSEEYQLLIFHFVDLLSESENQMAPMQERLLDKILSLKMVRDFNTRGLLISSLQLLIKEPALTSTKKLSLLQLIFEAKTHAESHSALTHLRNLLGLGYGKELQEIKTVGEIPKKLNEIFQKEFHIQAEENFLKNYEESFRRFRKISALFTYLSSLKKIVNPEQKSQAITLLSDYVKSILDGSFKKQRYDEDTNPHLKSLFQERASLQKAWVEGESASDVETLLPVIRAKLKEISSPGKEMEQFFKQKLITDQHVKELNINYPTLAAYLQGRSSLSLDQALHEVKTKLQNSPPDIPTYQCLMVEEQALLLMNPKDEEKNQLSLLKTMQEHLPEGEELKNDLKARIIQMSNHPQMEYLTISDTDDPEDLLLLGTEVSGSCQRVDGSPNLNMGLLGYLHNGQTRAIVIKDKRSGTIVCRALIRLLMDKENNKPVLFLERFYTNSNAPELPLLIQEMALRRAKALSIPLLSAEITISPYKHPLHSLGGKSLFEYVDSARGGGVEGVGVQLGPYTILNSYQIQE